MDDGEEVLVDHVVVGRVNHHRRCDPFEGTRVDEVHLASVGLLGRCSQDGDADPEIVHQRGEGDARTDGRGRDDVVSAGVAYLGKGIDLAADHDFGTGGPDPGGERRVHPVRRVLDVESPIGEERGEVGGCLELLVGDLGMVVHPSREFPQFGLDGGERFAGCVLAAHHGSLSIASSMSCAQATPGGNARGRKGLLLVPCRLQEVPWASIRTN